MEIYRKTTNVGYRVIEYYERLLSCMSLGVVFRDLANFRLNSPRSESDRGEFLPEIGIGSGIALNANLLSIPLPVLSQEALVS